MKRPLGRNRLRRELKKKGVDDKWIEAALERACQGYDEKEVVRDLVRQKMKRMHSLETDKTKARLFGYLVRRGFPQNLVVETILEEIR
jgi:regulatory protein